MKIFMIMLLLPLFFQILPSEFELPNDLILSIAGDLYYLDTETLEIIPFHSIEHLRADETVRMVQALSWSPQGDLLAVLYDPMDAPMGKPPEKQPQICILDRSGKLQSCFDTCLDNCIGPLTYLDHFVSWSPNGKSLYFVGHNSEKTFLLGGNPKTGEITSVVYEYLHTSERDFPNLTWTDDLHYLAIGFSSNPGSYMARDELDLPVLVIDMQTNTVLDLTSVFAQEDIWWICPGFSPQSGYLAAVGGHPSDDYEYTEMLLFDVQGEIKYSINLGYAEAAVSCPSWFQDESAFFINDVRGTHKYTLSDEKLETLPVSGGAPTLSPDEDYLVLVDFDGALVLHLETGEWQYVVESIDVEHPLWVPNEP